MLNHQEYNISRILIKELSERFSTFWQTFVLYFRYTKRGVFLFYVLVLKITNLSAFRVEKYSLFSMQTVFLKHNAELEYLIILFCLYSSKGRSLLPMSLSKSVGLSWVSVCF